MCDEGGNPRTRIDSSHQKTSSSRRTIDLDPPTVTALRNHRTRQLERQLEAGPAWEDTDLVFTNATGGCLYPNGITQELAEATEEAGVVRIRFHDLRHTHATLLLKAGVNPKVISERLRHRSVSFTLDTYAHVMPGMQREAVNAFQQLVEDAGKGR